MPFPSPGDLPNPGIKRGSPALQADSLLTELQVQFSLESSPIISWQIEGEKVETDFLFLGSKITAEGDYSHEIRRRLLLGRKAMINLDSVLKSRDITLPTKYV